MENNNNYGGGRGGDLTDILLGGGGGKRSIVVEKTKSPFLFLSSSIPAVIAVNGGGGNEEEALCSNNDDDWVNNPFGHPFSNNFQDPLPRLLPLDHTSIIMPRFQNFLNNNITTTSSSCAGGGGSAAAGHDSDQGISSFTRMLQICQNNNNNNNIKLVSEECPPPPLHVHRASPVLLLPVNGGNGNVNGDGMQQISSPPNPGIKRRKSQVKKVVCIPATAPSSSSRPATEVVPSDLWSWRKYGQKPIKGSPYPRSYYRCSSSKGCPARKQVERSRSDPNMLVITYTCEHNHPWPTQRNALAGSTRTTQSQSQSSSKTPSSPKPSTSTPPLVIKKEIEKKQLEPPEDIDDFRNVFPHSYKPVLTDDFFAELGELEMVDDPMNLLFPHESLGGEEGAHENKSLDPFTLYEWMGIGGPSTNNTSDLLQQDKKGS